MDPIGMVASTVQLASDLFQRHTAAIEEYTNLTANFDIRTFDIDALLDDIAGCEAIITSHEPARRKRSVKGANSFLCHSCDRRFDRRCDLNKHIKHKHKPAPYQCAECPKRFLWPKDLRRHVAKVHDTTAHANPLQVESKTARALKFCASSSTADVAVWIDSVPTRKPPADGLSEALVSMIDWCRSLEQRLNKLRSGLEQALSRHEPAALWVHSVRIDQSQPSELSGAVASVSDWYRTAENCYAHLNEPDLVDATELDFGGWFTRSWTLQEHLSPAEEPNPHEPEIAETMWHLQLELCDVEDLDFDFENFAPENGGELNPGDDLACSPSLYAIYRHHGASGSDYEDRSVVITRDRLKESSMQASMCVLGIIFAVLFSMLLLGTSSHANSSDHKSSVGLSRLYRIMGRFRRIVLALCTVPMLMTTLFWLAGGSC